MSGRAWRLSAGSLLKITDVAGSQSGDLFAVPADDLTDGQSNGRTFDYGGTVSLTTGSILYSRRSRPLMKIVEDEVGRHDFLYAPCSQEMYEIQYGAATPQPNCYDNLTGALAAFAVPAATVTIAFNFFMNTEVGQDGKLRIHPPVSRAGQSVSLRAECDLVVAVTACPAGTCNGDGGGARPLDVEVIDTE
ncbi:DUF1989 domain-containing protein [Nonomuraea typhae]|uniref:DUF1989 domain-containing protein n=1 Tax=Nonomuraea typhae TaxID=2603600 RepID=UPI0012FA2EAB|nr:urea carboxylase-associated family protein [Nonomuraea typhae]